MSYTLTVPLKTEVDNNYLITKLDIPYQRSQNFIHISSNYQEHGYAKKNKNAIFCSYKPLPPDVAYYLSFVFSEIAIHYGLRKICKVNKKSYPYYYYDSRIVYIISKEDKLDFNEYLMYDDFDIQVQNKIEDINIHAHINKNKIAISEEEFNKLFGDNELLIRNCKDFLRRMID